MKIEIIDTSLKSELANFVYETDIIPKQNEIISFKGATYVITDIVHNLDAEIEISLLVQPAMFEYEGYLQ